MSRIVVNVSTTDYYRKGQKRLEKALWALHPGHLIAPWGALQYEDARTPGAGSFPLPKSWPKHDDVLYGFKAASIKDAGKSFEQVMWCDSSILPVRSLEPIWAYAEKHGAWIANNGYTNYEWTADSAYPDLFAKELENYKSLPNWKASAIEMGGFIGAMQMVNKAIPHVVATAFALDLRHSAGKVIFDEYCRLGLETRAFCGPWINSASPDWLKQPGAQDRPMGNGRVAPCGPPDVRGHRHDQTALSVCAWRAGAPLTHCPEFFSYPPPGWSAADPLVRLDERTILVADGSYV